MADHTSEEWLREKYHGDGLDMTEIAEMCDVAKNTVHYWMKKHGVERRDDWREADGRLGDEEWLREQYHGEGHTLREIADITGVTAQAVRLRMEHRGVERRNGGQPVSDERLKDAEWLREKYHGEGLSTSDMADLTGTTAGNVYDHMRRQGVETTGPQNKELPDELDDPGELRDMYERLTIVGIADDLGVDRRTVRRRFDEYGIEVRNPGSTPPAQRKEAANGAEDGDSTPAQEPSEEEARDASQRPRNEGRRTAGGSTDPSEDAERNDVDHGRRLSGLSRTLQEMDPDEVPP